MNRFEEITQEQLKVQTQFNSLAKQYDDMVDCDLIKGPKQDLLKKMEALAYQLKALGIEQSALLRKELYHIQSLAA